MTSKLVHHVLAVGLRDGLPMSGAALEAAFACRTARQFPVLELYCRPQLPAPLGQQLWDETGLHASRGSSKAANRWRAAHLLRPEHAPEAAEPTVWASLPVPVALEVADMLDDAFRDPLPQVADLLVEHRNLHVRAAAARCATDAALDTVLDEVDRETRNMVEGGGGNQTGAGAPGWVPASSVLGRALAAIGTASPRVRLRAVQRWTSRAALAAVRFTGLPSPVVDTLVLTALVPEMGLNDLSKPRAQELAERVLYALRVGVPQSTAEQLLAAWTRNWNPTRAYSQVDPRDVQSAFAAYGLDLFPADDVLSRSPSAFVETTRSSVVLLGRMEALGASAAAWQALDAAAHDSGGSTWDELIMASVAATS